MYLSIYLYIYTYLYIYIHIINMDDMDCGVWMMDYSDPTITSFP